MTNLFTGLVAIGLVNRAKPGVMNYASAWALPASDMRIRCLRGFA